MSWKYKKYKNYSRSYKPKYYFSMREIDFTHENLNYEQFLLQEFFTSDVETFKKICERYKNLYNSNYIQKKQGEWLVGCHMTDLMRERITAIMPNFLSDEAKYKLGIHEFMASIKNTIKSFQKSRDVTFRKKQDLKPNELVSIFEKEYEKIQALTIQDCRFNVLTEEERKEALQIIKYILEIKLSIEYDQIERDFNIFLAHIKFNSNIFKATYIISDYNLTVDLTNIDLYNIDISKFRINEIEANSRYKIYSDKYLAYELISIKKKANISSCDSLLNSNDIKLYFAHFEELSNGKNEVTMNSTFQGEAGILLLKGHIKPVKLLNASIIASSIKLGIYFIVFTTLFVIAIKTNLIILFLLGSFLLGPFIFSLISAEIKQLNSLKKELKTYG